MSASLRRHPHALFFLSAFAVLGTCIAVVRSRAFAANPDVAAWGVTFDLAISIPALYWFLVVRTGKARPLTVVPVFLAGTTIASLLIPRGDQQFLRALGTVLVPVAEVLLVAALVRRVVVAARQRSSAPRDVCERITLAARTLAGEGRVADVIASEAAMFYFAFAGWRKQPEPVPGKAITFHERSGWGTIAACILVLIAAEGVGMHFLLGMWSPVAAWAWTGLDLWGAIWILGDANALRLHRSYITEDALHIRFGMRWNVTIPREQIASIEEIRAESDWKRKGVLKLAILDDPRWLVTLREPVIAHGLVGLRKEVHALALLPDQDEWMNA